MGSLRLYSAFLLVLLSVSISHQVTTARSLTEECNKESIVVTQARTARTVEGQAEYEVTVANTCECAQSNVTVLCYGLSSVETVDPRAIRLVDDANCLVNGGRPVVRGSPVKFRYAWMNPQDFPIVSTDVSC